MKKQIVVAVAGVMVCLTLSGCGQENPRPSADQKAPPPEAAKTEEYKAVDPEELDFRIMGFSGGTEIGEGGVRIMGGTFEKFTCEGTEIACTANKIVAGVISTKDYGNIKVSSGTFGGLTVSVTASQKEKLLKLKKPAEKK